MSKKIKALVQKYEKDMQFENRFDELKSKLDLIPDSEPSHDVYVIKRKVMPAYVMIIVLLMLVTGIIGLQFGLNTNYVTGPEQVDKVEDQLSRIMDVYEREAIQTFIVNDNLIAYIYIGKTGFENQIVIRVKSKLEYIKIKGTVNGNDVIFTNSDFYVFSNISDYDTTIDLDFVINEVLIAELNAQINLEPNFTWLVGE